MLKEETEQWPDVQQEMSVALKEMRVDPDKTITVKLPTQSNANLLEKRRQRVAGSKVPSTINEQMSTDENN